MTSAKAWLLQSRVYTRQFVTLRPAVAAMHFLVFLMVTMVPSLAPWGDTMSLIFLGIEVVIMTLAFWAVEHFTIDGIKDILIDNNVEWKCLVFNILVVYTFFQQIFLYILCAGLEKLGFNIGTSADTINYFLIIIEM